MNVKEIKRICRKNNFVPLRRRGQNFLINPKIIKRIIDVAEIDKNDIVLEIGSGLGALTKPIADKCKKIIAVEIDKELVKILREFLGDYKNIEIIKNSILDGVPYLVLKEKKYKVIANLPFNITGKVLRILLTQKNKPELIVVVVQKEVAQRIVAQPPCMSLLSLAIQFYSEVSVVFGIDKTNFWPQPRVDSMVLKIKPNKFKINKKIENIFFQLIKSGFSSKRKYLLNNLSKSVIMRDINHWNPVKSLRSHGAGIRSLEPRKVASLPRGRHWNTKGKKEIFLEIFKKIGLSEKVRAQELSLEQWIEIASKIEY